MYRPRIFLDASYINETPTGGYVWAPSGFPGGNIVEGKNAGGSGERWAILPALADWRDEASNRIAEILRESRRYSGNRYL